MTPKKEFGWTGTGQIHMPSGMAAMTGAGIRGKVETSPKAIRDAV